MSEGGLRVDPSPWVPLREAGQRAAEAGEVRPLLMRFPASPGRFARDSSNRFLKSKTASSSLHKGGNGHAPVRVSLPRRSS